MTTSSISLGSRMLGERHRPLVIAEVGQAHDGSLGIAHSFIDAIADAGADAVKFQTHIASAESTAQEPWRVKFSLQDATRFDYWRRMEFTEEQWRGLKEHAGKHGLLFLSSPFSDVAVDWLERLQVPAWKVASGEITNLPLLRRLAATGRPLLLSSGMSGFADLDRAVQICRDAQAPFAVFQCTTAYPCPPEKVGLNLLESLRQRYQCPVGLSDHSGKVFAGLAAAALGTDAIEVHVTFSRHMFGPDAAASLEFTELAQLVEGVKDISTMWRNPVDKEVLAQEMAELRAVFGKSIALRVSLPAGTVLKPEHLAFKKPGTGVPAARLEEVLGRRLVRDIAQDAILREQDLQ